MGLFKDSFDVGAGATLGNLTVQAGYQMGEKIMDTAVNGGYVKYRTQYFDPVIRADLNDIMVNGHLVQKAYPFPDGPMDEKKMNIFQRHKFFTIVLVLLVIQAIEAGRNNVEGMPVVTFTLLLFLAVFMFMGIILKKFVKAGGKAFAKNTYENQLNNDGQQYWYVREYVRQALDGNELTIRDAILKISNTRLAQQFPDTVEEIEANAFYYKQRISQKFSNGVTGR